MTPHDYDAFVGCLQQLAETYGGRRLTEGALATYWSVLERYPLDAIKVALSAHAADPDAGRFMPMPAHVVAQLQQHDGRPTGDEAWAVAINAQDEQASVVWTLETAAAYWQAAHPLLDVGDKVAARKAFLDRYERLTAEARLRGEPVRWEFVAGHDREGQGLALAEAVRAGKLPREHALAKLPALPAKGPMLALLGGVVESVPQLGCDASPEPVTPPAGTASDRVAELRASLAALSRARLERQEDAKRERAEQREKRRAELLRQAGRAA